MPACEMIVRMFYIVGLILSVAGSVRGSTGGSSGGTVRQFVFQVENFELVSTRALVGLTSCISQCNGGGSSYETFQYFDETDDCTCSETACPIASTDSGAIFTKSKNILKAGLPSDMEVFTNSGTCYGFQIRDMMIWDEVERYCHDLGLDLVTITDAETQTHLQSLALRYKDKGLSGSYWTSGHRDDAANNFLKWSSTGDLINTHVHPTEGYSMWLSGEPSSTSEQCLIMWEYYDFIWNDSSCTNQEHTICQTSLG